MEFGAVALLAAATAGLLLMRARANDPLTLALGGWAAVVLGFWLLAILTAIERRASLAAQPVVAILAGLAIARAAQDGRWARVAAAAAIASIVLRAVSDWTGCLGLEGFWRILSRSLPAASGPGRNQPELRLVSLPRIRIGSTAPAPSRL